MPFLTSNDIRPAETRPNQVGVDEATREAQEAAAKRSKDSGGAGEKDVHKLLAGDGLTAKYKIEVTFVAGRTTNGPNRLGIQVWESGKRLHGGGDDLAFFCKDTKKDSDLGCWGVIISDNIKGGLAFCPHCKRAVNADRLTNMKIGYVTTQSLAKELAKLFRDLGSSADVYVKYHRTDIHYIAMEKAKGPDVAKKLKGMHIYTLKNVVKDTSAGADLTKRFEAFLRS
jgi:glutaredoxin